MNISEFKSAKFPLLGPYYGDLFSSEMTDFILVRFREITPAKLQQPTNSWLPSYDWKSVLRNFVSSSCTQLPALDGHEAA
jgi:hypothetical protein